MLKLAEFLSMGESNLWTLCQQMGLKHAVVGLPQEKNRLKPWDYHNLLLMKTSYENAGFEVSVIESRPPANKIKLGHPGRDEEIAVIHY